MSDLSWKVAHCVLYTAQHLGSFGLPVPLSCFSGAPVELLYIPLFFKRFKSSHHHRYFHRQWGACGVVASVVDGCLLDNI